MNTTKKRRLIIFAVTLLFLCLILISNTMRKTTSNDGKGTNTVWFLPKNFVELDKYISETDGVLSYTFIGNSLCLTIPDYDGTHHQLNVSLEKNKVFDYNVFTSPCSDSNVIVMYKGKYYVNKGVMEGVYNQIITQYAEENRPWVVKTVWTLPQGFVKLDDYISKTDGLLSYGFFEDGFFIDAADLWGIHFKEGENVPPEDGEIFRYTVFSTGCSDSNVIIRYKGEYYVNQETLDAAYIAAQAH